jgi:hypothetical protein
MDSENNYDIIAVNNSCDSVIHSNIIVASHGSDVSHSNKNITSLSNQQDANAQYDNTDNMSIKPLYGGILKNIKENILFTIKFKNKIVNIDSFTEKGAIKIFLKNKTFKKDHILEIIYKNRSSLYIIKNNYKNKFIKIN